MMDAGVSARQRGRDRTEARRRRQTQHQYGGAKARQVAYSVQELAPKNRHGDRLYLEAAKPPEPFQTSEPQRGL